MDKIRSVEAIPLVVPTDNSDGDRSIMPSGWNTVELLLVRVEDESGNVGWGECFAYFCQKPVAAAITSMIAPLVVGQAIDDIAAWNRECQQRLLLFGRGGLALFALSGVDIALWDLRARRENKSLARLLNPDHRVRPIEAYASFLRFSSPERVVEAVRTATKFGFRKVKIHEIEKEPIKAGLGATKVGNKLMIDANCQLSAAQLRDLEPLLKDEKILWVEEPVFPPEDYATLASLGREGFTVACGECAGTAFEFQRLLDSVPYAQPDLTKIGGISPFLEVVALAKQKGRIIMPHGAALGPGYMATLNLFTLLPPESVFEYFWLETNPPVGLQMPRPRAGYIGIPDGMGIGFTPSPALLESCRVT